MLLPLSFCAATVFYFIFLFWIKLKTEAYCGRQVYKVQHRHHYIFLIQEHFPLWNEKSHVRNKWNLRISPLAYINENGTAFKKHDCKEQFTWLTKPLCLFRYFHLTNQQRGKFALQQRQMTLNTCKDAS